MSYIAVGQVVNFRRGIDLNCRELTEIVKQKGSSKELALIERSRRSIPEKSEMTREFLRGLISCLKIAKKYMAPDGKPFPFGRYMLNPFMGIREKLTMFSTDISRLKGTYMTLLNYELTLGGEIPAPVSFVHCEEDICCRRALME